MNYAYKSLAVLVLSAVSISAFAKDKPMKMNMGMEMSEEMKDKMARKKQIYILKVDALSDQIQDEKNAKKKQALMDEQLKLIRAHQDKKRHMKKMMMQKHMQKMMDKKKGMNM